MDWSVAIIVWIVCGIAALLIAQSRQADNVVSWFIWGVLLGPLGVLYAMVSAKPKPQPAAEESAIHPPMVMPPAPEISVADELAKLVALREAGELSPAEFARQRLNLLGVSSSTPVSPAASAWPTASRSAPAVPTSAPAVAPTVTAATEAKSGRSGAETLVIGLILVAVVGGAFVVMNGGRLPSGGTVALADLPPAGTIWFGDSFDAGSFVIRGRTIVVGSNEAFSFVAHLTRSIDASELAMRIWYEGQLVTTQAVNATGSSDVWGFSPGPLFEAGEWRYELTDVGGNVLASGTVAATD